MMFYGQNLVALRSLKARLGPTRSDTLLEKRRFIVKSVEKRLIGEPDDERNATQR